MKKSRRQIFIKRHHNNRRYNKKLVWINYSPHPYPSPLLGGEWLPPEDACTKNVHELVFADVSFVFADVSLAVSIA